jgi:hypothetical protein
MAKTAAEKAKQEAAYAWHAKQVAKRSGAKAGAKVRASAASPTPAQVRMKKSERIRKKFTPSGLQSMVDAMGKKEKPKRK